VLDLPYAVKGMDCSFAGNTFKVSICGGRVEGHPEWRDPLMGEADYDK